MPQDFRKLVNGVLRLSTDTFGEEVTFYPKCGGVYKVRAIFDNDYQTVDVQSEQLVSSNQPALGLNLNDIKWKIQIGDEVQVRTSRLRVQEKKEDGQGGATLLLHFLKETDASKDTKAPQT